MVTLKKDKGPIGPESLPFIFCESDHCHKPQATTTFEFQGAMYCAECIKVEERKARVRGNWEELDAESRVIAIIASKLDN